MAGVRSKLQNQKGEKLPFDGMLNTTFQQHNANNSYVFMIFSTWFNEIIFKTTIFKN